MIYHITKRAAWEQSLTKGHYSASSLDSEGFIHCSTRDQVLGVAQDLFRGQSDLVLLCINEKNS